jgi:hypothetical protein
MDNRLKEGFMPYHVFARVTGHLYPPGDCNLKTEEEVLRDYCIPYLEGTPITIAGAVLERKDIIALVIFLSDLTSFELIREAPNNIQRIKSRGREFEAMKVSESSLDITSDIMKQARALIGGNIKSSEKSSAQPSSINIFGSTLLGSPVTGIMEHSTVTITMNKPEIEDWLNQITNHLKENNIQNEELNNAVDTLNAALQAPKPSGIIIKPAVEAIKSIGFNLVSSKIWQYLMTHPPI